MRPIPAEEFSTLVGRIYDCALDPGLWPAVLSALCETMRFRTSTLALQEMPGGRVLLSVNHGITEDDLARMLAMADAVAESWGGLATLLSLPLDEPMIQSRVYPQMPDSRFAREWGRPLGMIDVLAIGFTRDSQSISSLGFGRHRDEGPIGDDTVETARLFVPHLKRSLAISRLLEARAVERDSFAAVLDGLAVAVLLVGPDLRLLHANRAGEAMLRTDDPLGLRHGRITAPTGLAAALQAALAAPRDGIGRRGLGVPARRADGEELVLHLLPLGEASPLASAAAAIFVAPAVVPPPAPLAAVAGLFDLTGAEARVLELVGAGRTNAEIATALGIAVSTVRTHLLHLFEKTGTHRQTELAALLASFTLPIV